MEEFPKPLQKRTAEIPPTIADDMKSHPWDIVSLIVSSSRIQQFSSEFNH